MDLTRSALPFLQSRKAPDSAWLTEHGSPDLGLPKMGRTLEARQDRGAIGAVAAVGVHTELDLRPLPWSRRPRLPEEFLSEMIPLGSELCGLVRSENQD